MTTLNATVRDAGNIDSLKKEGKVPAVMYGRKTESKAIAVDLKEFLKVWREAGESTVFTLNDGSEEHDALIHEIQVHPITEEPYHVDFYILEKGQTVSVNVPLEFIGEAPVSDLGGQIVKVLHELPVEGKAKDLPHMIEVDISALTALDSQITVADLKLPNGVVATAEAEEVIATVSTATEEPEEPTEAADISQIEVEKKGKAEEEQE